MNMIKSIIDFNEKKGFICDMDGVIYHGNQILPGVPEFIQWLHDEKKEYLFLTNNSGYTPRELNQKLARMGLDVPEEHFYTSALATAAFLKEQAAGCSAFVIGEAGLLNALYDVGITMNDVNPDYVVVGEGRSYSLDTLTKATNLVLKGAKLIGANSDVSGPIENGIAPACRALVAPIEMATGTQAYFCGKPNPLMMRTGLNMLGTRRALRLRHHQGVHGLRVRGQGVRLLPHAAERAVPREARVRGASRLEGRRHHRVPHVRGASRERPALRGVPGEDHRRAGQHHRCRPRSRPDHHARLGSVMFRRSVERRNDSTLRSADAPDLAAMPTARVPKYPLRGLPSGRASPSPSPRSRAPRRFSLTYEFDLQNDETFHVKHFVAMTCDMGTNVSRETVATPAALKRFCTT